MPTFVEKNAIFGCTKRFRRAPSPQKNFLRGAGIQKVMRKHPSSRMFFALRFLLFWKLSIRKMHFRIPHFDAFLHKNSQNLPFLAKKLPVLAKKIHSLNKLKKTNNASTRKIALKVLIKKSAKFRYFSAKTDIFIRQSSI